MYIDRILAPIETLGPGKRLVIWTKGCGKHCPGCANPELWSTAGEKKYSVDDIVTIIRNIYKDSAFDGVTISGGDPLEQIDELLVLLESISDITNDVIVYTGFYYDEIINLFDSVRVEKLRKLVAVLIDGPYIEELNQYDLGLRGSSNQNIIFFDETVRDKYEDYLSQGRKIQNVYMGNRLISVGIHNRKEESH